MLGDSNQYVSELAQQGARLTVAGRAAQVILGLHAEENGIVVFDGTEASIS